MTSLDLIAVRSDLRQHRAKFIETVRDLGRLARPRVLIADDNLAYARLLQAALHARRIDADIAVDEGSTRMALARCDYDLLVLDGARGDAACENVPAIYVSGLGPEARVDVSKADGISRIADEVVARLGR